MNSSVNIIHAFLDAAMLHPEQAALIQGGRTVTFSKLRQQIMSAAERLTARGFQRGDHVLVFVPMSPDLYVTVLALLYIGAVPVFLDEWVSLKRMKVCLEVVPCRGIIAGRLLLAVSWFIKPLRRLPVRMTPLSAEAELIAQSVPAAMQPADTALITFTTGSTGIPKAANRTHQYLRAQLDALTPLLQSAGSRVLTTLPIIVLLNLALGKATILPPQKFKIKKPETIIHLAQAIVGTEADTLIVSPSVLQSLLEAPAASLQLKSVHDILTGGGPVYPDLATRCLALAPQANSLAVYGSTEAEPISHAGLQLIADAENSVLLEKGLPAGKPDPVATVGIIPYTANAIKTDSEDALLQQLLPAGIRGEIIVKGAHVLERYINNPAAERQTKIRTDKSVWHRTGDLGMIDEHGHIFLSGRCQDVIQLNDQRFYPDIVACLLNQQLRPFEAAMIAVSGAPCIVTTLSKNDQAGISALRANMAAAGIPDTAVIIHLAAIPKDPRHRTKIDYGALRKKLSA